MRATFCEKEAEGAGTAGFRIPDLVHRKIFYNMIEVVDSYCLAVSTVLK